MDMWLVARQYVRETGQDNMLEEKSQDNIDIACPCELWWNLYGVMTVENNSTSIVLYRKSLTMHEASSIRQCNEGELRIRGYTTGEDEKRNRARM